MTDIDWTSRIADVDGGRLAYFTAGSGEPLVFLSGGPGDSHAYLRPVAAPFSNVYQCVLYDQRGTGQSHHRLSVQTLSVDALIRDLEHLQRLLGGGRLRLVGHSWGATLALLYGARHPDALSHLVLMGMGPLNESAAAVAGANVERLLTESERAELTAFRRARREAVQDGDGARAWALHMRSMAYTARSWFYDRSAVNRFLAEYGESPDHTNFTVHQLVNASAQTVDWWSAVAQVHPAFKTMVLYGRQDFEPIEQAFHLQAQWPHVTVTFINRAGHLPWRERPAEFDRALRGFLGI